MRDTATVNRLARTTGTAASQKRKALVGALTSHCSFFQVMYFPKPKAPTRNADPGHPGFLSSCIAGKQEPLLGTLTWPP